MSVWHKLLRAHRLNRGLTQRQVAERAGTSPETISRLERGGARRLDRRRMLAIAQALGLTSEQTRLLFAEAGLEPPSTSAELAADGGSETALIAFTAYAWPCLLLNERLEVVAQNGPARAVAGADFSVVLPRPYDRSLMQLLIHPLLRHRLANWDEAAAALARFATGHGVEIDPDRSPTRYTAALAERLRAQQRDVHLRLLEHWRRARPDAARLACPIAWRAPDGVDLRFICVLSLWSARDGLWALDSHPADAATWRWLADHAVPASPIEESRAERAPWAAPLRDARRAVGLTQEQLARAVADGVSEHTLASYETGRRRPTREIALAIARAVEMDTLTRNRLLRAIGETPPPPTREADAGLIDAARVAMPRRIEARWWPVLVIDVDQRCRIAATNGAARALLPSPLPDSLPALVLGRHFRRRVVNWEEAASAILPSALKQAVALDSPRLPAWQRDALAAVHHEDPAVLPRLSALFAADLDTPPAGRAVAPLIWRTDSGAPLSFTCVLARWTAGDALWALDLFPADAETFAHLSPAL